MTWLAGPTAWKLRGPVWARYTLPKVLRSLLEAIVICLQPWQVPDPFEEKARWFVDAARQGARYVVGIWGGRVGCRSMVCPAWVDTQQSAELYSIMAAAKMASYMGVNGLAIIADNTAAIAGARKGKGGIFFRARQRIFRQLHHTLRWSQQRFVL